MHFSFPLQFFFRFDVSRMYFGKNEIHARGKYVKLKSASFSLIHRFIIRRNITGKILMNKEMKKQNSHVGFFLESCSQIIAHLLNRLGLLICLEECSYVTMLHPPNCNHSHLDKKIFAYLNVPFSIASGKLMVQINYSFKKDNRNIVFVPVKCRFLNGFLF